MPGPRFPHKAVVRTPTMRINEVTGNELTVPGEPVTVAAYISQGTVETEQNTQELRGGQNTVVRRGISLFEPGTVITSESTVDALGSRYTVEGDPAPRPPQHPKFIAVRLQRMSDLQPVGGVGD